MTSPPKAKPTQSNGENIVQHGAMTLEFIPHGDNNETDSFRKTKVWDIITQMYVRAKKRGRPSREEDKEAA